MVTGLGRLPSARWARVTDSRTARRLARTAIQTPAGFGGAGVLDGLGPLAPNVSQGSFDGAYHLGQWDIFGRAGQPVAAGRAAAGSYDTCALQVVQDILHELRDTLGLGDPLPNGSRLFCRRARQLGGGAQRVISLGRHLQLFSHSRKIDLYCRVLSRSSESRRSGT